MLEKSFKELFQTSNKKLTLELGGKSANIIFEDAAIDQAVEGIVNGIFFNQGHVCCAGSRLFVQEGVADEVIQKLKDRMDHLYWVTRWIKIRTLEQSTLRSSLKPLKNTSKLVKMKEMKFMKVNVLCLPKDISVVQL
jgi:hypothetical protein